QDTKEQTDKEKTKPADQTADSTPRKPVEIEVLGGERYPGNERWYLLRPAGKPVTLKEVEAYFKEHGSRLELKVVLTDDSPDRGNGPIEDLTALADRYQIPTLREERKKGS